MKKYIFVVTALVFLGSCKKDYTCTCTYTEDGVTDPEAEVTTIKEATKAQAQANCVSKEATDGIYSYSINCDLSK